MKNSPIVEILNSPWVITREKLSEIQQIYFMRLSGEKIDLETVEAQLGKPMQSHQDRYDVQDGVAVIPVEGVIGKKMNLFTRISGGASTQLIGQDISAALKDPGVHSILLSVDSPGGTVDGTQALADQIFAARGVKPIYAVGDGMMASAAYWIGSAADKVFTSGDTTAVGSIGVVAQHVDYSRAEEKQGIKITEISAGKYKRITSEHAPLTSAGAQYLQDSVDHIYSVFVDAVAKNRGVSSDTVLSDMAEGRVFLGKQAVKAGLVDGVATEQDLITRLAQENADRKRAQVSQYFNERK